MTDKPTGVFVRLHDGTLSEKQIAKICNPKRTMTENLLALGTPVTGGELPIAGFIAPKQSEKAVCGKAPRITLHPQGGGGKRYTVALVRQSDHLAALASLQAEVGQLRAALGGLLSEWDKLTRYGSPIAKAANERVNYARRVLAALKGPEA